jgi:L,D-transpeptidase YcbB
MRTIKCLAILMVSSIYLPAIAQINAGTKQEITSVAGGGRTAAVERFYELNGYKLSWLENPSQRANLLYLINASSSLALDEKDYQYSFLRNLPDNPRFSNWKDSVDADIKITDAAIHFYSDLKYGNAAPVLKYDGLNDKKDYTAVSTLLYRSFHQNDLNSLVLSIQPRSKEYINAINRYTWMSDLMDESNFKEVKITWSKVDIYNKPLVEKLHQLGILKNRDTLKDNKQLLQVLKEGQKMFDVYADGKLSSAVLSAFNVSLNRRVKELALFINYLRWMDDVKNRSFLAVLNIPAANLFVYQDKNIILDSKVITGKPSTPTPTLSSTITEVILYPYWMVPKKIATRELLPRIKRNPGYIDAYNYQVLNSQGRVVNPYAVNWHALSTSYFPYTLRQCTGCDNALGIIKFNFYNPYTVYLHDTPNKELFKLQQRYFSHGCMRVEKPLELARLVLGYNRIAVDTITAKGCLKQQAPLPVKVERQLPLYVMYSTVWFDKEGEIKFYGDVYGKLPDLFQRVAVIESPAIPDNTTSVD